MGGREHGTLAEGGGMGLLGLAWSPRPHCDQDRCPVVLLVSATVPLPLSTPAKGNGALAHSH